MNEYKKEFRFPAMDLYCVVCGHPRHEHSLSHDYCSFGNGLCICEEFVGSNNLLPKLPRRDIYGDE